MCGAKWSRIVELEAETGRLRNTVAEHERTLQEAETPPAQTPPCRGGGGGKCGRRDRQKTRKNAEKMRKMRQKMR